MRSRRASYGIDAPRVVGGLALIGLACGAVAFGAPRFRGLVFPAGVFLGEATLMVWSSGVGKRRVVRRMLDALELRGDERLLDVGCGRGLVLIEAAKRLRDGRAVGVDVWRRGDQSGNTRRVTLENAEREGVAERVKVPPAGARAQRINVTLRIRRVRARKHEVFRLQPDDFFEVDPRPFG